MVPGLIVVFLCQLAGEAASRGGGVPLPGPVIGLVLLLILLLARDRFAARLPSFASDGSIEATGKRLVDHLSLLFVPAGVGVVGSLDVLATSGLAIAAALVFSALIALPATAAAFAWASRGVRERR